MRRPSPRSAALVIQVVGWPLLGLLAAARFGASRRSWLLDLVDTWQLYLLAPWPSLGLLAAALRSASLGLLAASGSALALACGQAVLGRARRPCQAARPALRVLTANVLGGNPCPAGLAALIEREQPDLVALQEVQPKFGAALSARLGSRLPYFVVEPHERHSGAAIFSRWPLDDFKTFRLDGRRGHFCQHARLMVDGRPLHLLNIHLDTPFELYRRKRGIPPFGIRRRVNTVRDDEIDRLIELASGLDGPVVVLGDFNSAAGSRPHRQLVRHLRDAFREIGRGLGHTFPQAVSIHGLILPFPVLRIDYVFFRGPLEPLAARTLHQPGSDHRAVLAEFTFADPHRPIL